MIKLFLSLHSLLTIKERRYILKFILVLIGLMISYGLHAEKVYVTKSKAQADMVVKVVDSRAQADLVVHITDSYVRAENDNYWMFVESKATANIVVFFTESHAGSTKVYFTQSSNVGDNSLQNPVKFLGPGDILDPSFEGRT